MMSMPMSRAAFVLFMWGAVTTTAMGRSFWCSGLWESSGLNLPAWLDVDVSTDGKTQVTYTQQWFDSEFVTHYTKTNFPALDCEILPAFELHCDGGPDVAVIGGQDSSPTAVDRYSYVAFDATKPNWNIVHDGVTIGRTLKFDRCAWK